MIDSDNVTDVTVLDRSYKIKCPADQTQDLKEAAKYIDDQMRKIRQSGAITSTDRIAIVTALNICHDFMQLKKQKNQYIDLMSDRIKNLHQKIESVLASSEETSV